MPQKKTEWARAAWAGPAALGLTRREQLLAFLPALAGFALLGTLRPARAADRAVTRWLDAHDAIAAALSGGEMGGAAWCSEVERLAGEIDIARLMAAVRAARLTDTGPPPDNNPHKHVVRFLDESGAPRRFAFGAALFAFEPHNVITPHAHRHMVSAHLVVEGAFRVRNFDRVRDEDDAIVIRPTGDRIAGTGIVSTMCSERDNVHWFVPQGGPAITFDLVVSSLDAGMPDHEITTIDPLGGADLGDGTIRAPKMSFDDSSRRYTAEL